MALSVRQRGKQWGFKMGMKKVWDWVYPFPSFGWDALAFSDKLKLVAFFIQAGAGVAMTAFASYVMLQLAQLKAVWPLFYLGATAMLLIGIIVTGLAGLLIKRSVELEVGPVKLKAADAETAAAMAPSMETMSQNVTPVDAPK